MDIEDDQLTEHDKAMINVAEQGDPNDPSETNTAQAPDLPEGVESVEDLLSKYNELSKAPEETTDNTVEDDQDKGEENSEDTESDDKSDEQETEEVTLSDTEIELRELKAYEVVGGKDEYAKVVEFAKENLTPEQIDFYDQAVNGPDNALAMFAVQGIRAMQQLKHIETFGTEGEMTDPSSGTVTTTQGFETQSDMMAAMADPRYQTDETYVNQVMRKVALSTY